ncbi:MAG: virulence factor family protein [Pedobacter sp.]|nr:MAG: virulence factor family protein [Pedobacter sp.]
MIKKVIFIGVFILGFFSKGFSQQIDTVSYGKFGKIAVYHPIGIPTSVALFVSGDGGWKTGVVDMARSLAAQGALVLGIDARHYEYYLSKVKAECLYPAADFEELSIDIQKKYNLSTYHKPVLVGYSYGAVLVYGILVQAPANTFKGALALGFCPDINVVKPFCPGNGLTQHVLKPNKSYYLEATKSLTAPFIVLNGAKDQTCPYEATAAFLKDMPRAELIGLDKVGHGFAVAANWLPDFSAAYGRIVGGDAQPPKALGEPLPLTVVSSAKKASLPFVFMISGDGGWTSFDQSLAEALATKGMYVIGLDAQKYFWKAKTPALAAAEVSQVILKYQKQFDNQQFVLAGYSFGASIVPFLANRLPLELKKDLKGVVSLSPDDYADFEIHITDMLNLGTSKGKYDVLSEIKKVAVIKPVCIFGKDEDEELKQTFIKSGIKTMIIPGNHHFTKDFAGIANTIAKSIQ